MSNKEASLEELLGLLESELTKPKDKPPTPNRTPSRQSRYKNQIERFIREKEIKAGPNRVPVHRIFYEYIHGWDGVKGISFKSSAEEIGRVFSQHFPKHRSGAYRYYMLNDFCDLSKKKLKETKKWYDTFYIKRKKTQRQSKASKHKPKCEPPVEV